MYFECVMLVNLVLLRQTSNYTGYGEFLIFGQVTSFIWILYFDTILIPTGTVGYFFDEYWSSWTAWLGFFLISCIIFLEKAVYDAI